MHIAFLFRGYTLPDVHASSYTISYICLFGYLLADKVAREKRHDSRKCRKDIVLAKTKQLAQEYESTDKEIQVGDGVKASYEGSTGTLTFNSQGGTLWSDWADRIPVEKSAVKAISFRGSSGKVYLPKNSSAIFSGLSNIKSLNAGRFDTSKVTEMQKMFEGCGSLTGLDLTKIRPAEAEHNYNYKNTFA